MSKEIPFGNTFDNWCKDLGIPDYVDPDIAMRESLVEKPEIKRIIDIWGELENRERVIIKCILFERYCQYCGVYTDDKICHCENDE